MLASPGLEETQKKTVTPHFGMLKQLKSILMCWINLECNSIGPGPYHDITDL